MNLKLRTGLRSLILFGVMGLVTVIAGCGGINVSDRDIVLASHARTVQAVEFGNALVIDVRTPEIYETGHIPGSLNIPIDELTIADPRLISAGRVIVYSDGGTDPLSRAAAKKLLSMGWIDAPNRVQVYQGGVIMWENAGLSLEGSGGDIRADEEAQPATAPSE